MSSITPYRLTGGKSNNILFLTHNDSSYASNLRNRTAVLSWAEAEDSPTLLQTKSDFDIYALITATYGHTTPIQLSLIGSKGNYIYYKYLNNVPPYDRWIIEVDYTSWTITKLIFPRSSSNLNDHITWIDGDSNILYAVTTRTATNVNLRKVLKYDYTSYNPITMYFDTIISSFECLYNFGVASVNSPSPSISGDNTGFLSRWMVEINETAIVTGGAYDIISYNSDYEETGQFSDAREKYLGWHCDRPNNNVNLAPNGALICGLPSGRMFTVDADGLFYSSDTNTHMIEWDATTFQAIRTSKLDTGIIANPWIDADIQPSTALIGMSKGVKPDFQTSQNCTLIGLGALDSTIYTTIRYNFKENSVLSTSPNQYRVFKPDAPCDASPPLSEWCPATTYLVQKREWLVGNDEHTITMSSETDNIKPTFVNSPHPWWLKDIVVTSAYVFILLGANEGGAIGYHWLLQCNASTMAVIRYRRLNVLGDDYQLGYVPWSIAGNESTIYVYLNGGGGARIEIIDVASFNVTGIVTVGGPTPGYLRKIGGDGANGYIYSTYYTYVSGLTHLWLQKRNITDFLVTSYGGVSGIDITSTYYPSSWVSPPSVSTDPRLWALGAGGNRLYLGGLDCIHGTTDMVLYEFDPITLEFIRSSTICGAVYVPPRLNTQVISFW